jgi:hypothetical protein
MLSDAQLVSLDQLGSEAAFDLLSLERDDTGSPLALGKALRRLYKQQLTAFEIRNRPLAVALLVGACRRRWRRGWQTPKA